MDSLRFRFGKILVWVGETRQRPHGSQASAILKIWHSGSHFALVYATAHEKPQLEIRESWHNCKWQYFQSFDRGIVILSVFMALHRVVLPAMVPTGSDESKLRTFQGPYQDQISGYKDFTVNFTMQIYKKPYHICGNFLLFSFSDTTLHLME